MSSNTLKMKELESRTGVGREAIRFYIREGILPQPEKPQKNVALYSEDHVMRIRLIKRLQADKFLPLGRIKEILKSPEVSNLSTISNLTEFEFAFSTLVNGDISIDDLRLKDVTSNLGFSKEELLEMQKIGIVQILNDEDGPYIDKNDIGILEKWREIQSLGFKHEAGYDLNFLNRYVEITRIIGAEEVDQFLEVFGSLPTKESALLGAQGVEAVNEIINLLHKRAVRERISEYVSQSMTERENKSVSKTLA